MNQLKAFLASIAVGFCLVYFNAVTPYLFYRVFSRFLFLTTFITVYVIYSIYKLYRGSLQKKDIVYIGILSLIIILLGVFPEIPFVVANHFAPRNPLISHVEPSLIEKIRGAMEQSFVYNMKYVQVAVFYYILGMVSVIVLEVKQVDTIHNPVFRILFTIITILIGSFSLGYLIQIFPFVGTSLICILMIYIIKLLDLPSEPSNSFIVIVSSLFLALVIVYSGILINNYFIRMRWDLNIAFRYLIDSPYTIKYVLGFLCSTVVSTLYISLSKPEEANEN